MSFQPKGQTQFAEGISAGKSGKRAPQHRLEGGGAAVFTLYLL
jgi:hypothetical protein